MEDIILFISNYNEELLVILYLGFLFLFVLGLVSQYKSRKAREKYQELVRGMDGINIEELLIDIQSHINNTDKKIKSLDEKINSIDGKLSFAIRKVGFIRYNAFSDMGSELSFSIALLDDFKNGFVLSSIYGRENTVSYGKSIENGTSNIPLSAEEVIAIDRAMKGEYKPEASS